MLILFVFFSFTFYRRVHGIMQEVMLFAYLYFVVCVILCLCCEWCVDLFSERFLVFRRFACQCCLTMVSFMIYVYMNPCERELNYHIEICSGTSLSFSILPYRSASLFVYIRKWVS